MGEFLECDCLFLVIGNSFMGYCLVEGLGYKVIFFVFFLFIFNIFDLCFKDLVGIFVENVCL